MKQSFCTSILASMALAILAANPAVGQTQDSAVTSSTAGSTLPAGMVPGTPLADVVKMLQANVDAAAIKAFVLNSQSPFNLDAEKILFLKDEGAPNDLIDAMMERDRALATPPPMAAAPVAAPVAEPVAAAPDSGAPDTAPPAAEMTASSFDDTLAPYGTWVEVDGYGRCWRPTVAIYDAGWTPYGDRGHWVNSDCGWYWDSDYAWGLTFHYGRWFRSPQAGWCWYPDTVWAPSWVTWRSGDAYCGWAPLPPFAEFRPGVGFFYRGAAVEMDFDFGLSADCFIFVAPDRFCDRHPRGFMLSRDRAFEAFHETRGMNHFEVNGRFMVNRGFGAERISVALHRPMETVRIGSLPNAGRQGWHGDNFGRGSEHGAPGNHDFNPAREHEEKSGPASRFGEAGHAAAPGGTHEAAPAQSARPVTATAQPVRSPAVNSSSANHVTTAAESTPSHVAPSSSSHESAAPASVHSASVAAPVASSAHSSPAPAATPGASSGKATGHTTGGQPGNGSSRPGQ
jgi:hypothetical protein